MSSRPVVHFEILGQDTAGLRRYYGALFGWEFELGDADPVSAPGEYGFVGTTESLDGTSGIPGGIGGGEGHAPRVLFYVGVPDVDAALAEAERLGGTRVMGPEGTPGTLVVGWFADPEGHVVGVAGSA
jgi:predicted enzyme related to lactoylglutathione lyase